MKRRLYGLDTLSSDSDPDELMNHKHMKDAMNTIYDPRYIRFIDYLRAARCRAGLTQAEAACRIKMSRAWIGKIERRELRLDCLHGARLCVVYRVDVGRLMRKLTVEQGDSSEEGDPSFTYWRYNLIMAQLWQRNVRDGVGVGRD